MVFDDVTLTLPDREIAGARLRVEHGTIREFGPAGDVTIRDGESIVTGRGGYLSPGFIDLHAHGALGRDAMEAAEEAFAEILRFHAAGGTTALALTTVAAPLDDLRQVLNAARAWLGGGHTLKQGAGLLGIHVEGPYLATSKAGAHRAEFLRHPSRTERTELLDYADVITQVTLAPELPGALDLIEALWMRGIIASGGHSNAWEEEAWAALGCGMRQVTHLFNAMSSARRLGAFRVAGLLEIALAEPDIRCELIADGRHVSPILLRLAYRAKGADGICLVTDACPGAGLPEGSRYRFADQECVVRDGVCLTADGLALAGSRATMIECVRNMVRLAGVPLVEAARMATLNPARALRRDHERGRLATGLRADLVLLTRDLEVAAVWIGGENVFRADRSAAVPA